VNTRHHDEWEELAAAFVLHALEPADEQRFVAHHATCSRCQTLVEQYELTTAHLASLADVPDVEPPAWSTLRAAILGEDAALSPVQGVSDGERRRRTAAARGRRPSHWWTTLTQRRVSLRTAVVAAALSVAVAVGVTVWQTSGGGSGARLTAGCATETSCRLVTLHGKAGDVVLIVQGDNVSILSSDLPPLDARHMYVLWQQPLNAKPLPLVGYHQAGSGVWVRLAAPFDRTQALMVSAEPKGALPATASNVLAAAELSVPASPQSST